MSKKIIYTILTVLVVVSIVTGCASSKGSSSLDNVTKSTAVTKKGTPTVRADQKPSSASVVKQKENREAGDKAIDNAKASAQAASEEAQKKLAEAKAQAEEMARRASEEAKQAAEEAKAKLEAEAQKKAEAAAQKAKEEAEKKAAEAAAKAQEVVSKVVVRKEKATVLETKASSAGQYHVIVGSFKSLENAKTLCEKAAAQGYLPSVLENADGMFRVSVFTADEEEVSRQRLVEILKAHTEYTGAWLLKLE